LHGNWLGFLLSRRPHPNPVRTHRPVEYNSIKDSRSMLRFRSISHRISAINQPLVPTTRPCFSLPAPLTRRPTYRSSFSSAPLNPSTTTTTTTTTTTSTNAVPPPQNPPSDHDPNLLLTEYVYGRSRIYTSLPTTSKSPTASKQSISSSITSPLYWRWQRSRAVRPDGIPDATWRRRRKFANLGLFAGLKANLNEMFLPVGYPDTVHECYARFHSWLFLETYIGSAIGVLCSQAMLASLGLGAVEATGGAVAIQWVLKDGFGEIGKLFFIKRFSSSFDSHPKTWKFVAEIFSTVGSFLQLCTSVAPHRFFLPLASVGNMFELVHESIWVASHMTFTRNFALSGNVGDIVAKDDAQMSTAHLLGMLSGVGLITISHSPTFLFGAFALLSPLNIWSTYKLLQVAQFEILNQAKLTLLGRVYIDTGKVVVMNELGDREVAFGEWIKPFGERGGVNVAIKLGVSAEKAFAGGGEVQRVVDVMRNENYLLNYHRGVMNVLFHQDATSNDVIRSILHALRFHDLLAGRGLAVAGGDREREWDAYANAMRESLAWTRERFGEFVAELDRRDWQSDVVFWNDGGLRVNWYRPPPTDLV
ncbi:vitamin B6 photo-protection and homoeostasis-domain-containing protein, partial [Jimgerdemannia flammicorona]